MSDKSINAQGTDVDAQAREDLALPVERQMIIELRDQDVAQKIGAGQAPRDRRGGGRRLNDLLADARAKLVEMLEAIDDLQAKNRLTSSPSEPNQD